MVKSNRWGGNGAKVRMRAAAAAWRLSWRLSWRQSWPATALLTLVAGFAPVAANGQTAGANGTAVAATPTNPAPASLDMTVNGSIASDYNYRGYTLSNHRPSAAADFDATYDIWFVDINAASVEIPGLTHLQNTDTFGVRPVIGALTLEFGTEYYAYPGSSIDIAYFEYYAAPTYAVTPQLTLGLNFDYAPNYSRTGAWENYNSVTAKYTFDSGLSLSGELGRQSFGGSRPWALSPMVIKLPLYTYWNLGFSYTYKAVTFDLRYYATTLSRQSCYLITGTGAPDTGSNGCDPAIVATLSWNANLSGLK